MKAGDTFLKEVEIDGAVRVTETEEIIAKCKHDVLPELRGLSLSHQALHRVTDTAVTALSK